MPPADTPWRVEISVRELVELTCRRGDIGRGAAGSRSSALEGALAHRAIQAAYAGGLEAERSLAATAARGGVELFVTGRADGVDATAAIPLVEEIKSTATPLVLLHEGANPLHFAQADAYAAMLAAELGVPAVRVRLTYVSRETREVRSFERIRPAAELGAFFAATTLALLSRLEIVRRRRLLRDATIAALPFPFAAYRRGQRELLESAAAALGAGRTLLAHVPTGAGKTIALLAGALRAVSAGAAEQILFLTSRGTGRRAFEKALGELRAAGLVCASLALSSREATCAHPGAACDAAECPRARGHFDRIGEALNELLGASHADDAAVAATASRHGVCPFELARELLPYADMVVGDLNYAFDPHVSPRVMQGFAPGGRIALVDEAHQTEDRAREMFSARLSARRAREAAAGASSVDGAVAKAARSLAAAIGKAAVALGEGVIADRLEAPPRGVVRGAERFVEAAELGLAARPSLRAEASVTGLYFEALAFLHRAERLDPGFVVLVSREAPSAVVELFCADPAGPIGAALGRTRAAAFFSGTLAPLDHFSRQLGGGRTVDAIEIPSPFPAENLLALVADGVDTRLAARGATAGRVAALVAAAVRSRPGNHLVFLPSYEYLRALAARLEADAPDLEIARQAPQMDEAARTALLRLLAAPCERSRVVFAVLGGLLGESVDLPGGVLAGAVVVTVGMPPPDPRREAIRALFDERGGAGRDVAYALPGAHRVLQAAGRVIRSETDRGYVLLVDDRLRRDPHRALIAGAFRKRARVAGPGDVAEALRVFWARGGLAR